MNKITKQKEANLYLLIPHKGKGQQVVNSKNLKSAKGYFPTEEILQTHFEIERTKMRIALDKGEKYKPQPLYLEIQQEDFLRIKKEAKINKSTDSYPDYLVLTGGSHIPCCLIGIMKVERQGTSEL